MQSKVEGIIEVTVKRGRKRLKRRHHQRRMTEEDIQIGRRNEKQNIMH